MRPEVEKFVERFQSILRKTAKTAISAPSEFDEVQLGEPLLAHLALTDLAFVPVYLGFLQIWDQDHEVEISGAVNEILKRHRYCEEVEQLLSYCLLEVSFASDPDLMFLQTFQDIHPGAPNTILFRRFIVNAYRNHLLMVSEYCRVYQSKLRSEEEDTSLSVRDEFYTYLFEKKSAFGAVEHRIIAELQASHLPTNDQKKMRSRWSIGSLFGK